MVETVPSLKSSDESKLKVQVYKLQGQIEVLKEQLIEKDKVILKQNTEIERLK